MAGEQQPEYDLPKNWHPFQVICPKCSKVGATLVTGWDGEEVSFECQPNKVEWAQGCGHKSKISPFGGTGKLLWKVTGNKRPTGGGRPLVLSDPDNPGKEIISCNSSVICVKVKKNILRLCKNSVSAIN